MLCLSPTTIIFIDNFSYCAVNDFDCRVLIHYVLQILYSVNCHPENTGGGRTARGPGPISARTTGSQFMTLEGGGRGVRNSKLAFFRGGGAARQSLLPFTLTYLYRSYLLSTMHYISSTLIFFNSNNLSYCLFTLMTTYLYADDLCY